MASGDIVTGGHDAALIAATYQRPAVRLVQAVVQAVAQATLVANATPITFTTEALDTNNFFNTATSASRVTPSKAGWYTVRGVVYMAAGGALTYLNISAWARKNGATNQSPAGRMGGLAFQGAPASAPIAQVAEVDFECLMDFNGTTDYVELVAMQACTGAVSQNTNVSPPFASTLELIYERDL